MREDVMFFGGLALAVLAGLAVAGYAIWYEYRYPCKRYESYACTQESCIDIGDPPIPICTEYQATCTRCAERFAERP